MGSTNSSGVAKVTLAAATYTFTLEVVGGGDKYTYDESACVVYGTTTTSVTVQMLEKGSESASGKEMIYANGKDYKAIVAGETNGMVVSIPAGDMLYVVFVPTREGRFSFSATASGKTIDCGYYGGTFNVLANKVDGGVKGEYQLLNVRNDNLGASYVLGFKTADGSAAEATVSITRTGDSIPDVIASAPWQEPHASSDYLVEYTGSTAGTLTDFDITDASLSIVKGSDGYYHLGNENGPVIMIRVDSASPYLGAFSDMSANGNVAVYSFEADGSLKEKIRYNYVIDEYVTVANDDGVVPLNDELIAMVKAVGDYKGWWDSASANYRFDMDENGNAINEVESLVHLFACCYYK